MSEFSMTPVFRIEYFYDAIINGTTPPAPVNRKEFYLAKIAGADVNIPYPVFRDEFYLAKIAGADVDIPEPVFREEFYLASLAGVFTDVPDPVFREEFWLYEWSGGGSHEIWETITGPIVSFTAIHAAALRKLAVELAPIQDLHGYDAPWPPGGGDNLIPTYTEDASRNDLTLKVNADGSMTINGTASATTVFAAPESTWQWDGLEDCWLSGCPQGGNTSNGYSLRIDGQSAYSNYDTGSGKQLAANLGDLRNKPLYFNIVIRAGTVCNNLTFKPMLNKGLSAQPFKPYANLCPISGHTGVTVYVNGINQWDEETESGDLDVYNGGVNHVNAARLRSKNFIPVKPSTTYYCKSSYANTIAYFYGKDKTGVSNAQNVGWRAIGNQSFTVPDWCYYVRFYFNGTTYGNDISINYPSTDTDYHAYTGNTYPITFPDGQTVYSGTLSVNEDGSGTLTVDRAIQDMGQKNYLYRNKCFDATIADGKLKAYSSGEAKAICSSYKQKAGPYTALVDGDMAFGSGYVNGGTCSAIFKNSAYTDAATFKSAMSGVQLCYELDTPVTIPLTASQISTLKGQNTIWVDDSDSITVEYLAN